jgi:hypothetical protein
MGIADDVRSIYGFLDDDECALLNKLAANCGNGVIVEIGSFQGKSTVALAKGAQLCGARVYAVDPHFDYQVTGDTHYGDENYQALLANLAAYGVDETVKVVKKASIDAFADWKKPIDLLWIDGSHEYEDVKQDFILWSKFVTGYIAMHDTTGNHPGVTRFLNELLNGDYVQLDTWRIVERVNATAILESVVND